MGISDQIFLFGTLFPDMVRKFWLSYGRFLLTSKRNPRCVHVTSLCIVTVASCMFQEDQTKPAAGRYNTHGCCCCALLWGAESSPVSRQLNIKQPATNTEGGLTGTCGSSPTTPRRSEEGRGRQLRCDDRGSIIHLYIFTFHVNLNSI